MNQLAAIGTMEWLLIFCVVALLFGARKIPELARSLGASVNEFKKGMKDGTEPPSGSGTGTGSGADKEK
jgi:sec-independent protein translocase protein TatA